MPHGFSDTQLFFFFFSTGKNNRITENWQIPTAPGSVTAYCTAGGNTPPTNRTTSLVNTKFQNDLLCGAFWLAEIMNPRSHVMGVNHLDYCEMGNNCTRLLFKDSARRQTTVWTWCSTRQLAGSTSLTTVPTLARANPVTMMLMRMMRKTTRMMRRTMVGFLTLRRSSCRCVVWPFFLFYLSVHVFVLIPFLGNDRHENTLSPRKEHKTQ